MTSIIKILYLNVFIKKILNKSHKFILNIIMFELNEVFVLDFVGPISVTGLLINFMISSRI